MSFAVTVFKASGELYVGAQIRPKVCRAKEGTAVGQYDLVIDLPRP